MLAITLASLLALQADPSDWHPDDIRDVTVGLRLTGLGGQIDGEENWGEFFGTGIGLTLGGDYLWKTSRAGHAGVYARLSYDMFDGEEADLSDDLGTFILDQDEMSLFKVIVGGKLRQSFKVFFLEEQLGIGMVHYSSVDTTVTDDLGSFDAELLEGGVEFAFEIALRVGFYLSKAPDAPTLSMTFAYEQNGKPDLGDDFSDVDSEQQKNFVWTLGASFPF